MSQSRTPPIAESRIRQIAILVSSVDATAARHLLLHLPTETAKQVRAMATQIGSIPPEERRAILAEFQKSASRTAKPAPTASSTSTTHASEHQQPHHLATDSAIAFAGADASDFPTDESPRNDDRPDASWTQLSTHALVRFVQGERTAVIAVVISQLAPHKAVEVLQALPREVNRAVLLRLSNLQEIDPDATAAIAEHLAERLSDYQHCFESEQENRRRMTALLEAAPSGLRKEWSAMLVGDHGSTAPSEANEFEPRASGSVAGQTEPAKSPQGRSAPATIAEIYDQAVVTTADTISEVKSFSDQAAARMSPVDSVVPYPHGAENAASAARPGILDQQTARQTSRSLDRHQLQIEFGNILLLTRQQLADLLSDTDSQTVLLALAGSTPQFMQQFTRMLDPADAKRLNQRLKAIGTIKLSDVDEAQQRIVDGAAAMHAANSVDRRQAA